MVGRRALWIALGFVSLVPGLAVPADAEVACRAFSRLTPERGYVGQAILQRTVLLHPEDGALEWRVQRRYPAFHAERGGDEPNAERIATPEGPAIRITDRTWLFPVRAGVLILPEARLRCAGSEIRLTGPRFEALDPPAAGRPPGWTGLVGAISVEARASPTARLGESVRVQLTTRGSADLGFAAPRLQLDDATAEIFPRPPTVTFRGGETLRVTRRDVFDVVPRRAGSLRIRPVRLAWFDPERASYHMAESEPLHIEVAAAAPADREVAKGGARASQPSERSDPLGVWPGVVAAFLLTLLAAGLVRMRRERGPDPHAAFRAALRIADRSDDPRARAAALEKALEAALRARGVEPRGAATQDPLEASPDAVARECMDALATLERARFAGDATAVDLDAIRALLSRL